MDAETKDQLRWKFYRLVWHINAVVILVALILLAALKAPEPFRIPLVLVLIVLVAYLSTAFYRNYHATKSWLEEHTEQKKPE